MFIKLASCTCFEQPVSDSTLRGWYLSLSLSHLLHPHPPMAPKCEPLCRFDDRFVQIDIGDAPDSLLTCRLYFTTFPHPPPKQETLNNPSSQLEQVNIRGLCTPPCESLEPAKHYYFTIDDQLMYMSFFQDWGPLNVAMVYKACIFIHSLLIVSDSLFYEM